MTHRANHNWLLVADVDDTLIGDDAALARFVSLLSRTPHLVLALNSSRPIASIKGTLASLAVALRPRAIIGAMGTEIEMGAERDLAWRTRFGNWDRGVIDGVMREMGMSAHDASLQTPLKASFAVPAEAQQRVREAIAATGLPVRIVASGASDFDVLPPGADKGDATLHLARSLGVAHERLIVAGDSGNDLAMFEAAQNGIVVGNARAELRDAVNPDRAYLARTARADGIVEGLMHYGALRGESADAPRERRES